jgi:hypothetical protein
LFEKTTRLPFGQPLVPHPASFEPIDVIIT